VASKEAARPILDQILRLPSDAANTEQYQAPDTMQARIAADLYLRNNPVASFTTFRSVARLDTSAPIDHTNMAVNDVVFCQATGRLFIVTAEGFLEFARAGI